MASTDRMGALVQCTIVGKVSAVQDTVLSMKVLWLQGLGMYSLE